MFIRTESFREFIRYYPVVSSIIAIQIILYLLTELPFFQMHSYLKDYLESIYTFGVENGGDSLHRYLCIVVSHTFYLTVFP